jgi:NTE family protein
MSTSSDGADRPIERLDRGSCLCLSGGGFRATLFHVGVIQRLNELGVLSRLSTITSVSGGSILNGLLACRWSQLNRNADGVFTNLDEVISRPMRQFCSVDIRTPIIIGGRVNPLNWRELARDRFSVSARFLADAYEKLYAARFADVSTESPRFIFCATNMHSGACWHFHAGAACRMGDFYTGYCDASHVRVSDAVAASSAFPFGFSALRLAIPDGLKLTREDPWGEVRASPAKRSNTSRKDKGRILFLTDGGVYDNLGVEPVWNRYNKLLVSDAGRPFDDIDTCGQDLYSRLKRASDISMEQVGAVRKRWLVDEFLTGRRTGAIWALHSRLEDFPLSDRCGFESSTSAAIQRIRTDLDSFSDAEASCLANHGYSLADAALRSRAPTMCSHTQSPFRWPDPAWTESPVILNALKRSGSRRILKSLGTYARSCVWPW